MCLAIQPHFLYAWAHVPLWQELLSFNTNIFIVKKYILLWLKTVFSGRKWFLLTLWIKTYKPPASPWITLSRAKCWPKRWGSHEAKYSIPPWSQLRYCCCCCLILLLLLMLLTFMKMIMLLLLLLIQKPSFKVWSKSGQY